MGMRPYKSAKGFGAGIACCFSFLGNCRATQPFDPSSSKAHCLPPPPLLQVHSQHVVESRKLVLLGYYNHTTANMNGTSTNGHGLDANKVQ
jgi:hypothetical protein